MRQGEVGACRRGPKVPVKEIIGVVSIVQARCDTMLGTLGIDAILRNMASPRKFSLGAESSKL